MKFYAGFMSCAFLLAVIAWTPGLRIEWTPERRAVLIRGRVIVEVLPQPESRALASER